MASSKTGRLFSFLLAMVFLVSTLAAIFIIIKQSNDAQELNELQTELNKKQEACKVTSPAPSSSNKPGDPPILSGPVSELKIEDTVIGTGETVALGDCITVNYRLTLADGSEVAGNNTFSGGQPIAFQLIEGGLIAGWTQGLPGVKVGGLRRLIVPAALAYGDQSAGTIPANSDLVFDIEVLDTKH